jgi:DNA gyrase/topoisomerase IV subunit A
LVTHEKIEEWVKEVEERPSSAPTIIRYIANRLSELSRRNEELLADNIGLRTEKKVDEFTSKIANLEYQVNLLKRQFDGVPNFEIKNPAIARPNSANLILYNNQGQIFKCVVLIDSLVAGNPVAMFQDAQSWASHEMPRFLVTHAQEELMLIFDSGRTAAISVEALPERDAQSLNWQNALLREPRSGEQLTAVVPIAKMGLYDYALQISRRGFAKKIMESSFESFLNNNFIGPGIKAQPDKPFGMAFARKEDSLVLISQEGLILSMDVGRLPFAVEEILQLSPSDHLEAIFTVAKSTPGAPAAGEPAPTLLVITEGGKVVNREISWIESASSFRSRGQALFSKDKRSAGVRIAGGGLAGHSDWGFALHTDGSFTCHKVGDLVASGSLQEKTTNLVGFALVQK